MKPPWISHDFPLGFPWILQAVPLGSTGAAHRGFLPGSPGAGPDPRGLGRLGWRTMGGLKHHEKSSG